MIASRDNVMQAFLQIYLIFGFLTIFVFSEKEEWIIEKRQAFQIAGCIAHCHKDKICRDKCHKLTRDQINPLKSYDYVGLANFNASLHCKDIDVIKIRHNPGIWVIEQSTGNDSWENTIGSIKVSDKMISSFTNLSAGALYRYKAYRVTENGVISEPEISPWFATLEMGHRSQEVEYMEVARQVFDDVNLGRVRADIIFQPASDRSCHYDIVSWNDNEGLTIADFVSFRDFQFALHNLDYETNVTVFVSARNAGNERSSNNLSLSFTTPPCLQMHDDANLTICAPEEVKGLRIKFFNENSSDYTLVVAWDLPDLIPENYSILIQSADYGNKESSMITLPGNTTESLLTANVCHGGLQCQLIISIIAISLGGTSPQSSIYVNLDKSTSVTSPAFTDIESAHFHDGIIVVPALAILALVLGLTYAYHLRRHSKSKGSHNNKTYKFCQNLNSATSDSKKNLECTFYSIGTPANLEFEKKSLLVPKDRFEIRPDQLKIKDILGSGASGIVRFGFYQISENRAIDVAVKTLKDDPSVEDVKNFHREILIMKSAGHHQNIVSIIGCCTIDVARPMLIVEYCSQGDLQTYLRTLWQKIMTHALERRARRKIALQEDMTSWIEAQQVAITNKLYDIQEEYILSASDKEDVSVADLLSFARQVACGMEFLSSNRIIHRDLAARNVLVCADKTVKISDFGLSRDIYQENVYKKQGNGRLPLKWMAIEALTHQIYTTQSDVWSFGILLWEIVTLGCNPYPDTPTNMVLQLLKSGYRMEKPENCGDELHDMMLSCWRSRPQSRPNFTQLKNQLDKLLLNVSNNQYLKMYDVLRDPESQESCKNVKHYSNIYSTR